MSNSDLPFSHEEASDSTGFLLWQVTALWQRQINTTLRPHGLTQVQFVLLAGLLWLSSKEDAVTQVMLSKHTKVEIMTTSQVLRTLETKGFIKRKPHPTDTRANALHLTSSGKEIVFAAIPDVERIDNGFFQRIESARKGFNGTLQTLVQTDP